MADRESGATGTTRGAGAAASTRRAPGPGGSRAAPAEDDIFERIHQAVLDHRLQPGTKLKEVALAQTFGVNRAVVRKVLARLSHHRLVSLRPNRAAVVASPSIEESRDIFAARRIVEAAIVDQVARAASRTVVSDLRAHVRREREAYGRGDARRGLKLSLAFHRELARLGGNAVLAEFLDQLIARTPLVVLAHRSGAGDSSCTDDAHAPIVDAIARGDADGAVEAMTAHLTGLESQLDLTDKRTDTPDFTTLFAAPER